jgi:hypothetical protein
VFANSRNRPRGIRHFKGSVEDATGRPNPSGRKKANLAGWLLRAPRDSNPRPSDSKSEKRVRHRQAEARDGGLALALP